MGYEEQEAVSYQTAAEIKSLEGTIEKLEFLNKNLKLENHKLQKYKLFYEKFSLMINNTKEYNVFGKYINPISLKATVKFLFDQLCLDEINNGVK